jgi:hypothetical protein
MYNASNSLFRIDDFGKVVLQWSCSGMLGAASRQRQTNVVNLPVVVLEIRDIDLSADVVVRG